MTSTPLSDAKAFSTGNAFIVLHKDAQEIERTLRAENAKLRTEAEIIAKAARDYLDAPSEDRRAELVALV